MLGRGLVFEKTKLMVRDGRRGDDFIIDDPFEEVGSNVVRARSFCRVDGV